MRKIFRAMIFSALCIFTTISACFICTASDHDYERITIESVIQYKPDDFVVYIADQSVIESIAAETEELLSQDEIELIALVTMAEAEGECEEGKRLVIDTILNRADSEHFPNTVYDVIHQPNQFSSMWNGRVERCEVRDDICLLVREELETRTNSSVMFFTAGKYSVYGKPMFQVESHYFSSYE